VPEAVRDTVVFHLVDDVRQVLEVALEPGPAPRSAPGPAGVAEAA
jgi:hypothetical protein